MVQQSSHSPRPTSTTYLTAARFGAGVTGATAAAAVGINTFPDALAIGGGAMALPFLAAPVVAILLVTGWHIGMTHAAHAGKLHQKVTATGFGVVLVLFGVGVSAWPLAGILGGAAAIQVHQRAYLNQITASIDLAAANGASESPLIGLINRIGGNLDTTAGAEDKYGAVGRNGPGQRTVWSELKNAAGAFLRTALGLDSKAQERDGLIDRAREDIRDAQNAIAAHDAAAFEQRVADAARHINDANAINLTSNIAGLDNGTVAGAARTVIEKAVRGVHEIAGGIGKQRRAITIPAYEPVDGRNAMLLHPQPWAWVVALSIEGLPMILLALLLAFPADEQKPTPNEFGPLREFERRWLPQRRPTMAIPAE